MIIKPDHKQSQNALYLQWFKGTKCLDFKMVVCVSQVPPLIEHTTNTVNHKIAKTMVKEDSWPIKFIVSLEEKVNSYFVITESDHTTPEAGSSLLNPPPLP